MISIMAGRRALIAYIRTLGGGEVSWDKTRHGSHPSMIDIQVAVA
jgi:adsorption protein B